MGRLKKKKNSRCKEGGPSFVTLFCYCMDLPHFSFTQWANTSLAGIGNGSNSTCSLSCLFNMPLVETRKLDFFDCHKGSNAKILHQTV